ncbi:MAG: glutamate synthase beta chain-related oxidoreductase [Proteobacteria bacterium]|nr:glutamate synthase beta chain-related oxidoreductase [Pseudomonadota bacterium]
MPDPLRTLSEQAVATGNAESAAYTSEDLRDIGWVKQNVPCQTACPAGTNVPAYIRDIVERRYGRSYEINRGANVLPGVLGRICSRPCEAACRHGWPGNGEPVAICHLKRVAADMKDSGHRITERLYAPTGKRIAIVGAGPAGVAAAHDLSLFGHDVVIFEREERPGGMLRYGIPEFRLPRDVLEVELHNALRLGVQLRTGVAVGAGPDEIRVSTLLRDYDAVLLATGCMAPMPLPLSGEWENRDPAQELSDFEYGLDFLMQMHRGERKRVGRRVAIVGAGFTALDCARVAVRLGAAEVTIHLRTGEDYIPVAREELFEAKREGIRIKGLRTPVSLRRDDNGRLAGVEFVQNRLGGWRPNGRRLAIPIEGSEFFEPCDTLIVAIGQQSVHDFLDVKPDLGRGGQVRVTDSGMTSLSGLFAAGDYVRGALTAVEAIGHGRQIALKIDAWVMGWTRRRAMVRIEPVAAPLRERAFDFIPRQAMPTAPLAERVRSTTREAETGMDEAVAIEEAKRCYLCNLRYQIDVDRCIFCRACIEVAPRNCIKLVKGVEMADDGSCGQLLETKEWNQVGAIWIDNRECIRCGACVAACPVHCISISRCELVDVDV